ncbi:SHOCT domain-containing protein [Halostagnicola bangensis]
MSEAGPLERLRRNVTGVFAILMAGVAAVGLATGTIWLIVAGAFGVFFGSALVALLFGDREAVEEWWGEKKAEQIDAGEKETDPLEELKGRYARGELSEAELEHKTQQLLEVDELARASDSDRAAGSKERSARNENAADSDFDRRDAEPDERELA